MKMINKLGVVGCGQMGTGIGLVGARVAGLDIHMVDSCPDRLSESRKFTEKLLDKDVARNRLTTDQKYSILEKVSYSCQL